MLLRYCRGFPIPGLHPSKDVKTAKAQTKGLLNGIVQPSIQCSSCLATAKLSARDIFNSIILHLLIRFTFTGVNCYVSWVCDVSTAARP